MVKINKSPKIVKTSLSLIDIFTRIGLVAGLLIISFSLLYFFIIFLPKHERDSAKSRNQTLAYKECRNREEEYKLSADKYTQESADMVSELLNTPLQVNRAPEDKIKTLAALKDLRQKFNPYASGFDFNSCVNKELNRLEHVSVLLPPLTSPKVSFVLPVQELPTDLGAYEGSGTPKSLPNSVTVSAFAKYKDLLSGYGVKVIDLVIIGPKDWLGNAEIGANGDTTVSLKPSNNLEFKNGSEITYFEVPACWSCFLNAASPFWQQAQDELVKNNFTPPSPIPGLNTNFVNPELVRFTTDSKDGLEVNGVAYIKIDNDKIKPPFKAFTTVLSKEKHHLAMELIDIFIDREIPK